MEVLCLLAIAALLAALAVPGLHGLLARQRLAHGTEILFAELQRARIGAIRRNRSLSARFIIQPDGRWCLGLSDEAGGVGCQCDTGDCRIDGRPAPRLDSSRLPQLSIHTNFPRHTLLFGPLRGGARAGSVFLRNSQGEARIVIGSLGRMRTCAERLPGYAPC